MKPEKVIVEFIVVFILFTAGYEIDWQSITKAIKPRVIVGIFGVFLSALLGFLVN
jgi:Kef-type K+ transport system membrane component KefB